MEVAKEMSNRNLKYVGPVTKHNKANVMATILLRKREAEGKRK